MQPTVKQGAKMHRAQMDIVAMQKDDGAGCNESTAGVSMMAVLTHIAGMGACKPWLVSTSLVSEVKNMLLSATSSGRLWYKQRSTRSTSLLGGRLSLLGCWLCVQALQIQIKRLNILQWL